MGEAHLRTRRAKDPGFTLVELLIVVIILSILAVVVIPQFTNTTDDARLAAADTALGNMRAVVDLYYAQHAEYPSRTTDGTNAANSNLAFVWQLARYTDGVGVAALTSDPNNNAIYGPYLKKEEVPLEPLTNSSALEIDSASAALGMTATGGDPGGWKFNNQTGQFIINHSTWEAR